MITENKLRKLCFKANTFIDKERYEIIKDIPITGIRYLFDAPSLEYKSHPFPDKILIIQTLTDIAKCSFDDIILAHTISQIPRTIYKIDGSTYFLMDFINYENALNLPITTQINSFIKQRRWENWITILDEFIYNQIENSFHKVFEYYFLTPIGTLHDKNTTS